MKRARPLFAKSKRRNGALPPTVEQHCLDVLDMATAIWDEVESTLAQALCMDPMQLRQRNRPLLLVAAILHDIMKANSSFQGILDGNPGRKTQPIRHEVLAAVQLSQNRALRDWLAESFNDEQIWSIAWAIGGHHFQLRQHRGNDTQDPLFRTQNVPRTVSIYLGDPQVRRLLESTRSILAELGRDPGSPPDLEDSPPIDPLDDSPEGLEAGVYRLVRESDRTWKRWLRDNDRADLRRDLALLKVLLIAADIAGSALPGSDEINESPSDWIASHLQRGLQAADLDSIIDANLDGRPPRQFQEEVGVSETPVTVVTAGCGNGKTTAAYMWAKKWAVGRKLFFTYPTTGTASAGFRDYLFAQTDLERDLIHGRASVDLQAMWESSDILPIERAQRLEALNAWGQQVIACTTDTVLGLIQNQRHPVFSFPAIVRGAFVFDEVHSYDRRMFAELLRFLETFRGIPVLIMSASIPPGRMEHLQRVAGDRMNAEPIRGDTTMEQVKRYTLHEATEEECWERVASLVGENRGRTAKKVLWVCNTVKTAVETCRKARETFPGAEVLLYHSRYRYKDRVDLQGAVIDEFRFANEKKTTIRNHERPAIVVTTQVCEMSLDISADLLVSAFCPLPSLVQRLGRLNRYAKADNPKPAFVFPFSGRPYHEGDAPEHLAAAGEMVEELHGQPCSQAMLAEYIDRLQSNEELPEYSAWLDGGWQSEPLPVREGDNSITLVREEDLVAVRRLPDGRYCRDDVIPLTIPMLFQRGFDWSDRAAGYPVASTGKVAYDWDESKKQGEGAAWPGLVSY